jgi:PAS domain S-box-containing protein
MPLGCFRAFQEHAFSDIQVPPAASTGVNVETLDYVRPAGVPISPPLFGELSEIEDFFENGAVALHLVGADGTILRANKAELGLLGYEAGEYIGRNIIEFHADHPVIGDYLARLTRGEKLDKCPARLIAKDGSIKHVEITASAQLRDGKFLNTRCFTVDVTDLVRARAEVRQRDDQLRKVLDALPAAVYTTDAKGTITYYNRAAVELAGREPELGKDKWCVTFRIYTPDGQLLPHDQCPMAMALKEKRPVRGVEAIAQRLDGTLIPFLPFPTPITNEDGELVGAVNMLVDITERKSAEQHQTLLVAELDHRVKNILAQVAVVAKSTRQGSRSIDEFLQSLDGRIGSMATAHRLLSESSWQGVGLCALVRTQLAPYATDANVTISGTDVMLAAAETQAMAMVLHELATNAAKHGALSALDGRVSVSWDRTPNGCAGENLVLVWREVGGPPVTANVPSGYGTTLIRNLVPHELGGKVDVEFPPDGVICRIEISLSRSEQR